MSLLSLTIWLLFVAIVLVFSDNNLGTKPEIFVIGSAKSGTSTLSHILMNHPDICLTVTKESHFFDNPKNFANGIAEYSRFFEVETQKTNCKYYVDATPSYIRNPDVPIRINSTFSREQLRAKKFVLILREPVLRECSWYFHMADFCVNEVSERLKYSTNRDPRFLCQEKSHSVSGIPHCGLMGCEARAINITLETVRQVVDPFEVYIHHKKYDLSGSFYDAQLEHWLTYIPRSQIFIINMDDLLSSFREVTSRLFKFLDLSDINLGKLPHSNGHGNYLCGCNGLEEIYQRLRARNTSENTMRIINAPGKPIEEPLFSPFKAESFRSSKHCTRQ